VNVGQLFAQGVTFGAIYAVVALGYHLIYVSSGVLNFALGEQLAVAGLICLTFLDTGIPMLPAVVAATLVGMLLGVVYERSAIAPSKHMGATGPIIASIGVALVYTHGRVLFWGPNPRDFPPFSGAPNQAVEFLGGRWLVQSFWVIGIVAALAGGTFIFLRRTAWGRAWRATAENPLGARLAGVNPTMVHVGSIAAVSAFITLAGVGVAPIVLAGGFFGLEFGVKGFAAALLGGFDSTPGVLIGGLIIGLMDSFLVGALSADWADMILYSLLISVLIVRPTGILGRRELMRA
jgi:branched-chain amino acid transport system permease protein